jgi:aryl-alcohol dehydrogenase-like predicted oxidoreductase
VPELRGKLVFGAASLGMAYGLPRDDAAANQAPDESDATAIVEQALSLGVTTFDTAPAYGDSELRLGRALGGRGQVWTKVAAGDPSTSLDASLVRLQRPSVQLLQWHNWTAVLGGDASWVRAWSVLRGDARVERLGATTYGVDDAVAAAESGFFDVVQCEFNLLNQRVVAALSGRSIKVAVRSVLLQGALTDEGRALPSKPALRGGVERARSLAHGRLTRFALRAALEHPAITHVLIGIDRRAQLDEAVEIADGPSLTDDDRAAIASLDLAGDPATDPRTWSN